MKSDTKLHLILLVLGLAGYIFFMTQESSIRFLFVGIMSAPLNYFIGVGIKILREKRNKQPKFN